MTVFLDTVGLLALWDESDQWHNSARESYSELLAARVDFKSRSHSERVPDSPARDRRFR